MIDHMHHLIFLYKIRRLKRKGLKIGRSTYIPPGVFIDSLYPFLVEIGDCCRFATGVVILSHDATTFQDLGITRIGRVRILNGCFIGMRAIILPGCTIGPNAIVSAGAIVNRDIKPGTIAAGNPARVYGSRDDLIDKYKGMMDQETVISKNDFKTGLVTKEHILSKFEKNKWLFMEGQQPDEYNMYDNYMKKLSAS